jgi:hypothetical protein
MRNHFIEISAELSQKPRDAVAALWATGSA